MDFCYPDYVCKLSKAFYGLKQALRAWYQRLSQFLLSIGFVVSSLDTSLFVYHQDQFSVFILIYVDDIVITNNSLSYVLDIISRFGVEFAINDLGPLY